MRIASANRAGVGDSTISGATGAFSGTWQSARTKSPANSRQNETEACAAGGTFAAANAWSTRATPTPDTLSPGAIARIKAGLTASGFAKLPAKLPSTVPAGAAMPPRDDPPRLERWTFTARIEDGSVRTVEVEADTRLPSSFEALEPLYRVLDSEIWGFYRNE